MSFLSIFTFSVSCNLIHAWEFDFNGLWTYSPSFEALPGILGIDKPGPGEDNLFLVPERNCYKHGNETLFYHCKMCNHKTLFPKDYVEHMKTKHFYPGHEVDNKWVHDLAMNQDFNESCRICNETFKTDMALLQHMASKNHFDDQDQQLCRYLRARLQLNETVGRKVVYHSLVRPFYREKEPSNESWALPENNLPLIEGFDKAKYIPRPDAISAGDLSSRAAHSSIIETGYSKYAKSDYSKRLTKINGVNIYQTSGPVEYDMTDETAENARLKEKADRLQARRDAREKYSKQDSEELLKQEEAESEHTASYYRRQLDEYGPWASHSDKVGDRKLQKITKKLRFTRPHLNQKEYLSTVKRKRRRRRHAESLDS